tara:strand:+ start:537 stop:1382 length:846 start_codon:yes stop_codon:yes gene_type:complete
MLVVFAMVAFIAVPAMAGTNWDGTGDWTDDAAANWNTGAVPPNAGSGTVNIRSGTAGVDTETLSFGSFFLGHAGGNPANPGDATLNMTGGTMSVNGEWTGHAENSGNVAINLSNNADMDVSGVLNMMYYGGIANSPTYVNSTSTISLSDNATLDVASTMRFGAGTGVGGGEAPTNSFHVQLDGGVLTVNNMTTGAGNATTRTMDLAGGTLVVAGDFTIPGAIVVSGFGANAGGGEGVAYNKSFDGSFSSFTGVPEPTTLTLLGLGGFAAFLASGRRQRRRR